MKTLENLEKGPDDPEPADERDIQMEYSSDWLYCRHWSIGAVTKNYLYELQSVWVPSDDPEYMVIGYHLIIQNTQ